jgi:hypothetical protein
MKKILLFLFGFFAMIFAKATIPFSLENRTIYVIEDSLPWGIRSVPLSVHNFNASVKDNCLAYYSGGSIFLGDSCREELSFFSKEEIPYEKFLFYNKDEEKNEIVLTKSPETSKSFDWGQLFLFFIFFIGVIFIRFFKIKGMGYLLVLALVIIGIWGRFIGYGAVNYLYVSVLGVVLGIISVFLFNIVNKLNIEKKDKRLTKLARSINPSIVS